MSWISDPRICHFNCLSHNLRCFSDLWSIPSDSLRINLSTLVCTGNHRERDQQIWHFMLHFVLVFFSAKKHYGFWLETELVCENWPYNFGLTGLSAKLVKNQRKCQKVNIGLQIKNKLALLKIDVKLINVESGEMRNGQRWRCWNWFRGSNKKTRFSMNSLSKGPN